MSVVFSSPLAVARRLPVRISCGARDLGHGGLEMHEGLHRIALGLVWEGSPALVAEFAGHGMQHRCIARHHRSRTDSRSVRWWVSLLVLSLCCSVPALMPMRTARALMPPWLVCAIR